MYARVSSGIRHSILASTNGGLPDMRRSPTGAAMLPLFLFLLALVLFPTLPAHAADFEIADLEAYRQDPFLCIRGDFDTPLLSPDLQRQMKRRYDSAYFAPWRQKKPERGIESLTWGFSTYGKKETFGENRRRRSPEWFARQRKNANEALFGTENRPAIAVCEADLRVFPVADPLFFDFDEAGEGYPFDYGQNSAVKPGEPLFVSHRSADGAWFFVDAPTASGWIDARRVGLMDSADMVLFSVPDRIVLLADDFPLTDERGAYLGRAKTGAQFPLLETDLLHGSFRVRVPLRRTDGGIEPGSAVIPMADATQLPLPLTPWNGALVASSLLAEPYGWGGLHGRRDCSALVMDFFAPFGIAMPRNSREQAGNGRWIDLKGKDFEEKERILLKEGIPFRTLVAMPGHIMLYIGQRGGRPLVFHNMWGVRTRNSGRPGRHIVGKAVITTLAPGMELPDHDGLPAGRITGLVIVGETRTGE